MRHLLDRSGEMVDLVGQISTLNEATTDLKAMQQVALAARPEAPPAVGQPTVDQLWKQLEKEWQLTRESFRSVAQSAGGRTHRRDAAGRSSRHFRAQTHQTGRPGGLVAHG